MKICNKCNVEKDIKFFYKDIAKTDGHRTICAECTKSTVKKHQSQYSKEELYLKYRETRLACKRIYAIQHKDKKHTSYLRFKEKNPGYHKAKSMLYQARKLQATPIWADLSKITQIYRECPSGYHVDHVVPLKGKNVCGLHVHYNLQHLPAIENIRKSNKVGI